MFLIIGLIIIWFTSSSQESNQRLLLYATFDSTLIQKKDSSWFNKTLCLETKIETIDRNQIKKDKDGFWYNKIFINPKNQLSTIGDPDNLADYEIVSFEMEHVYCPDAVVPRGSLISKSNCLNDYQIQFLKRIYHMGSKIWFSNIVARNKKTGKEIKLPGINFRLMN